MNDEQVTSNVNNVSNVEPEYDVVAEINKLKETTVSIDDYNRLKAERDKYAKALVEGTQVDEPKKAVPIADLREKLFGDKSDALSNLEYVEAALQLREGIMNEGGTDIFVGHGSKLVPEEEDYDKAAKVAEALQHCVDVAEGNSDVFTMELQRITNDVKVPKRRVR